MVERATIYQIVQIGKETTAGTAVAATKKLTATSIDPAIKTEISTFRGVGSKFTTIAALGKEWSESGIEGQAAYNDLSYLLAGIIQNATPVQQGATTAYKTTYTISNSAPDSVATYSVERGYSGPGGRAHKFAYGQVTELGLDFSRDEVTVSGSMLGQRVTDDAQMSTNEQQTLTVTGTPTGGHFHITYNTHETGEIAWNATAANVQTALEALSDFVAGDVVCTGGPFPGTAVVTEFRQYFAQTDVAAMTVTNEELTGGTDPAAAFTETVKGAAPTEIVAVPLQPTEVSVYMDSTAATLGNTLLTRVLSANWKLSGRFNPLWALNAAATSYATVVETEPGMTLELLMEADSVGMGLLTQMRAGSSRFIRVEAVSAQEAGTGYVYKLTLDMCGLISEAGEWSDEDGVYAIPWTFVGAHDSTWGKALQIELTNMVSAL